jgi:Fic family protein
LGKPVLYISQFFEKNRAIYFDRLQQVRLINDMESWLKFFLSGVIETSKDSKITLEKIIDLKKDYENRILGFGRQSKLAHKLLLFLFSNPIVSVKEVNNEFNISFATANSLIQKFLNCGLLKEITGYSRNRLFMLWKYIDLFKD